MRLRRVLPYTSAVLAAAVIYAAWTFYSRWDENKRIEQEAAARRLESDQTTLHMIGSDLKITQFYAPPAIQAGQRALICYGVANAARVRMQPSVEPLTPSLSRCIQATPRATTSYTLTAEDNAGHSVSQTITVKVQ
jgi:hypothetical protein